MSRSVFAECRHPRAHLSRAQRSRTAPIHHAGRRRGGVAAPPLEGSPPLQVGFKRFAP
jgi:hypothetical protein